MAEQPSFEPASVPVGRWPGEARPRESPAFRRPAAGAVRVVVGSGSRLFREALARALDPTGVRVVGFAPSPGEVMVALGEAQPDVVVLDLAMERAAGAVRALIARIAAPVVVVGVENEDADILAWAEAGIAGFVTRDGDLDDLVETIRNATRGELFCTPTVAYGLLRRLGRLAARDQPLPARAQLTQRELEIIGLIQAGYANKQIAARLGVALSTVKNHVHNILEKLNVTHRREAVAVLGGRAGPP